MKGLIDPIPQLPKPIQSVLDLRTDKVIINLWSSFAHRPTFIDSSLADSMRPLNLFTELKIIKNPWIGAWKCNFPPF